MSTAVLDASALLAWLKSEPGADVVEPLLSEAAISAVNWSESGQKIARDGSNPAVTLHRFTALGMTVVPFAAADAMATAELWESTSPAGLSLADRACVALARRLELPALTADRAWKQLGLDIEIQLIR